jgi:hypothetical protein
LYDEEPCNQNGYCNYMVTADCGDMCADASRGCCSDQCDKFSHNMQSTSTQCFPARTAWQRGRDITYDEGESWHESDVHETCPTPAEYSSSTTYPEFIYESGGKNLTDCDDYDYDYDSSYCNQKDYCNYMVTADCGDMCADASRGCCSDQCDKFSHNMQSASTQCFPQYMLAPTGTCSEPYTFIVDHSTCEAVAKILADEGAGITDITAWVVNPAWTALSPYGCYYKHDVENLFFNSEDIDAPPDTNRVCLCQLESMMESNSLTTSSSVSADPAKNQYPMPPPTTKRHQVVQV